MAGGGQGNLAAHALALVVPAPSSAWFRRCALCQVFLCPPGVRTETLVAMLLVEDSVADHLMGVTEAFFPSWVSAASLQASPPGSKDPHLLDSSNTFLGDPQCIKSWEGPLFTRKTLGVS